jgi:hypothetical protein
LESPNETLFEFENVTVPVFCEEFAALNAAPTVPVAAPEITSEPLLTPTVTLPAPCTSNDPIDAVPELACVVLPVAYRDCEIPVDAGAEISKDPCERPTEIIPAPTTENDWPAIVEDEDCPVVCEDT